MLKKILAGIFILCLTGFTLPVKGQTNSELKNIDSLISYNTTGKICTKDYSGTLSLRSGPGTDYRVYTNIPNGHIVTAISSEYIGNKLWYQVTYGRMVGWVEADYVCY